MTPLPPQPKYSIDTSSLVNPWSYNYRPSAFIGFWDRLEALIGEGHAVATEEVHHELKRIDDDLLKWCKSRNGLFLPHSEAIQESAKEILARFPRLIDSRTGRSGADPFVIALASVMRCAVVTEEDRTRRPDKPKIPDVCDHYRIRVLKIADVITEERWTFR